LINIQVSQQDPKALLERFGVTGLPALILMDGNGKVPVFGHIDQGIDALSVMDILELQTQADAALR